MNKEVEQITPAKQTPIQSQPSAKVSASKQKSTAVQERISRQGRKSQRSIADDVTSPNQPKRSSKIAKRKSSLKIQQSPKMQTPMAAQKSRQIKVIENNTGQEKSVLNRLSAPHTPKDIKNVKAFNTKSPSSKKKPVEEVQKSQRSKSSKKQRGVASTEIDDTKKPKKVFAVSNEMINIMVPHYTTKNKFENNDMIQADGAGKVEVWSNRQDARQDISFVDSDVADEFEYKYDPDYLSPSRKNQSPKVRMNLQTHQKKGRSSSTTPNINKKKAQLLHDLTPEKFLQSAAEEGISESNDFIKRTCKEISSARPKKKQKGRKNFVKRMVFDITKRATREKTFDSIKNVLHLKVGQIDTSRSMSPSGREFDGEEHSQRQSQSSNFFSPKKFTPKERDRFINRMAQYEERKQKAIEMLQDAKRQDEMAEYLQAIKNSKIEFLIIKGKMTEKEKQHTYDRLISDAMKRKVNQEQVKQQMLLQEEHQAKVLFRPKINSYSKDKSLKQSMKEKSLRKLIETEPSNANVTESQTLTMEQKIALFQQEAHSSRTGNRSNKTSALAMNTEAQLNFDVHEGSLHSDEEGQTNIIKSLKS